MVAVLQQEAAPVTVFILQEMLTTHDVGACLVDVVGVSLHMCNDEAQRPLLGIVENGTAGYFKRRQPGTYPKSDHWQNSCSHKSDDFDGLPDQYVRVVVLPTLSRDVHKHREHAHDR